MAVQGAGIRVPPSAREAGPPPAPADEPPFVPAPGWGHRPPVADWHPYLLLAAQALSIAPEWRQQPAVDS